MPLHRRIYQFLIIYFLGLSGLMLIKYSVGLSDYVIPGPADVWETWGTVWRRYMRDVVNTLLVAMVGQVISVFLAGLVGIFGRRATWLGQLHQSRCLQRPGVSHCCTGTHIVYPAG